MLTKKWLWAVLVLAVIAVTAAIAFLATRRDELLDRVVADIYVEEDSRAGAELSIADLIAQLELHQNTESYKKEVYVLPKHLDEEVARLHLDQLGVSLTTLRPDQAEYIVGQTIVADGGTTALMSLISDFRNPSTARFGQGYVPGL